MDRRLPIILSAVTLAVSGCQDEQTMLMAPPDPVLAGAAGADVAGVAVAAADSTTSVDECELVEVEVEAGGKTRNVYLCNRETDDGGGSASADGAAGADGDGTQICWYWVVEYRIAGVLVGRTEELLFCEEAPDPGGEQASLTLDCGVSGPDDEPPVRGEERNCVASLEGGAQDSSAVLFEWKSDHAAWSDSSDTGGSTWGGLATDETDVTVTVVVSSGENTDTLSETETVPVTARTWAFDALDAGDPVYTSSPGTNARAWGGYRTSFSDRGGIAEGTGPWAGRIYTDRPPRLSGTVYLHSDFDTTGVKHSTRIGEACDAAKRYITANVYDVNRLCAHEGGGLGNLEDWRIAAEKHEREGHEGSANRCLASGHAAKNVLAEMEALTGEDNGVLKTYYETFAAFYNGLAFNKALESDTATPTSPVIWEWRDTPNSWRMQALRPVPHTGEDGC